MLVGRGRPRHRREQRRGVRPEARCTKPRRKISTPSWTSTCAPPSRWRGRCCPPMRAAGRGTFIHVGQRRRPLGVPGERRLCRVASSGLRGLHEVLVAEYRGTGVRLSLLSPGPTDTAVWDPVDPDHRAAPARSRQHAPAGRCGRRGALPRHPSGARSRRLAPARPGLSVDRSTMRLSRSPRHPPALCLCRPPRSPSQLPMLPDSSGWGVQVLTDVMAPDGSRWVGTYAEGSSC